MSDPRAARDIVAFVVASFERRDGARGSWRVRRRRRAEVAPRPFASIQELAVRMVAEPSAVWVRDVLGAAEEALADASPGLRDFIAYGLFEDLQNVASHASPAAGAAIEALLGARSRPAWDEVVQLWGRVATEPGFAASMSAERLDQVQNAALRSFMEANYRRMPGGAYVGVSDVLTYESNHGGGPHLAKVG